MPCASTGCSLSEGQYLQHLEALFPPNESGPGDRFELSWWWPGERPHYTLHLRGQDGMRHPQAVDHVGALHERAVLAWVRSTTRAAADGSVGHAHRLAAAVPPAARVPRRASRSSPGRASPSLELEHQEGYVDPPNTIVEPSIHVDAH